MEISGDYTWLMYLFIGAVAYPIIQWACDRINQAIRVRRKDSLTIYKEHFTNTIRMGYGEIVADLADKMPPGVIRDAARVALDEYERRK